MYVNLDEKPTNNDSGMKGEINTIASVKIRETTSILIMKMTMKVKVMEKGLFDADSPLHTMLIWPLCF